MQILATLVIFKDDNGKYHFDTTSAADKAEVMNALYVLTEKAQPETEKPNHKK